MDNKKYYWLKLKDDFFKQKELKKLRNVAGGDTYTIIYLKMQLLSLKNDGRLIFDGIEDTFAEELSLELDEKIDDIKMTLAFLKSTRLIEELPHNEYVLPKALDSMGSETATAERMRKYRERQNVTMLQNNVTELQTVTAQLQAVTNSYTEIEKRREENIKDNRENSAEASLVIDELPFITNQALKPNPNDDIIAEIEQYFINAGGAKVIIKKDTKANMLKVIKDFTLDEIKKVIDFYSKDNFYLSSGFFNLSSLFRPTKFEEKVSRSSSAVAIHTTNGKIFNRVKEAYLDSVTNVLCLYITDIDDPTYIIGLPARKEYTTPELINAKLAELGSPLRYNDLPVYDTVEYSKTKGKGMFIPRYNMENK